MTDESDKTKKAEESIENHPEVQKLIAAIPAKKPIDPKFKQEISSLIQSGTTEKKMKALDIIENHHDEISGFFLLNTIEKLQKDPDETVRIKATTLSEEKFGNVSKEISKQFLDLGKIYEGTFIKLATDLATTSTAFTQMQDIAKLTRHSLDIPICAIDLGINWDLINSQANLFKDLPSFQFQLPDFSPILTTTEIITPIFDYNNQTLTIPEALGKSVSEVETELDSAISSNTDVIFNYRGYQLIFHLERFLREIIHERIYIPFESTLSERIDPIILKRGESRKKREEDNPLLDGKYRLIDQSDFSDIRKILENEENRQVFSDILDSRQLRIIISKLDELEPIRNKIAHSRPLTQREFDKLQMYAEDIVRLFKK